MGSGNNYCLTLLKMHNNYNFSGGFHRADFFTETIANIFILRDPYKCIASGIEMRKNDTESKTAFDIIYETEIKIKNYRNFINFVKDKDYIYSVTFEFLTERPHIFLKSFLKKFNIKNDMPFNFSEEDIALKLKQDNPSRYIREETKNRKEIDLFLSNYKEMKTLHKEYLQYANILWSTESMI
jgi:hypothetical protein